MDGYTDLPQAYVACNVPQHNLGPADEKDASYTGTNQGGTHARTEPGTSMPSLKEPGQVDASTQDVDMNLEGPASPLQTPGKNQTAARITSRPLDPELQEPEKPAPNEQPTTPTAPDTPPSTPHRIRETVGVSHPSTTEPDRPRPPQPHARTSTMVGPSEDQPRTEKPTRRIAIGPGATTADRGSMNDREKPTVPSPKRPKSGATEGAVTSSAQQRTQAPMGASASMSQSTTDLVATKPKNWSEGGWTSSEPSTGGS